MSKMAKLLKIFHKNSTLYFPFSISDNKLKKLISGFFPDFRDPVFPGKKIAQACSWSNSSPFCGKYKSISYFIEFGYLAEAGRYEKCKKHTFLGKKQIFLG